MKRVILVLTICLLSNLFSEVNDAIPFGHSNDDTLAYCGPVADFELDDENDHQGYIPHSVLFRDKSVPSSGQGSGECRVTWIFDGFQTLQYLLSDSRRNVIWEDSFEGLITGTYENPTFTYNELGSYDVVVVIEDTISNVADTLKIADCITVEEPDLNINFTAVLPNANFSGKSYTSTTPEIEIEVNYPGNNKDLLKTDVYLNSQLVLDGSIPITSFEWNQFSNGSAKLKILDESDGSINQFLKSDEVNEVYFVVYDESNELEVTSEVIEFWIDHTPPEVTISDEDGDMILGTNWKNNDDAYIYFDVEDLETGIRLQNCELTVKDKGSDDLFYSSYVTFEQVESSETGFKLRHLINFADFQSLISIGEFTNYLELTTTVKNRVGMETTVSHDLSFDFAKPVIQMDNGEIWINIVQDSSALDNDNDGKFNEDPLDGINNDGDWYDVNGNGRRDYYFQTWYEYVYDCEGNILDSISYKETLLEPEFVDEDPIDFIYFNGNFEVTINGALYIQLQIYDPEMQINYYGGIWTAASGIDRESFELYIDGELSNAVLGETGVVIIEDNLPHGSHLLSFNVSDHSGNQNGFNLRIFRTHDENDIEEVDATPTEFTLSPAYPNPFNPTTQIEYTLPKDSHILMTVYDSRGILLETIVNEQKQAGYHQINWDASGLPSGVYLYKLVADGFVDVKKCLLVK